MKLINLEVPNCPWCGDPASGELIEDGEERLWHVGCADAALDTALSWLLEGETGETPGVRLEEAAPDEVVPEEIATEVAALEVETQEETEDTLPTAELGPSAPEAVFSCPDPPAYKNVDAPLSADEAAEWRKEIGASVDQVAFAASIADNRTLSGAARLAKFEALDGSLTLQERRLLRSALAKLERDGVKPLGPGDTEESAAGRIFVGGMQKVA